MHCTELQARACGSALSGYVVGLRVNGFGTLGWDGGQVCCRVMLASHFSRIPRLDRMMSLSRFEGLLPPRILAGVIGISEEALESRGHFSLQSPHLVCTDLCGGVSYLSG